MRIPVLATLLFAAIFAQAQSKLQIIDAAALDHAPDLKKVKGIEASLDQAGLSPEQRDLVLQYGDRADWPEGIRSDTARKADAPYIVNYTCYFIGKVMRDSVPSEVVMIPAQDNIHMPEGMRPLADFYLVLPETALKAVQETRPRPVISRGPSWKGRAKAKIIKPDDIYSTYELGRDSIGLAALSRSGMSQPEIDAVVFRSTERNWPDGIDSFDDRYPLLQKFKKYHAWLGARWDDKVLLIIPVQKNRRMPTAMRPYVDLYFVYNAPGVKVRGK